MDNKPWYLSKGIIANGMGILLGALVTLGLVDIDGETRTALLEQGPELWVGFATTAINVGGLVGRIYANTKIRWPF